MDEKYKELREDVLDEQQAIAEVLERLFKIKAQFDGVDKDYTIEPAMGTYLMNFYNGLENIIKRISKEYYQAMPQGASWHKELLELAYTPPMGKVPILSENLVRRIYPYRNFRHRFISGYGFQLKGEKMLQLVDSLALLWQDIENDLADFWKKL